MAGHESLSPLASGARGTIGEKTCQPYEDRLCPMLVMTLAIVLLELDKGLLAHLDLGLFGTTDIEALSDL